MYNFEFRERMVYRGKVEFQGICGIILTISGELYIIEYGLNCVFLQECKVFSCVKQ